MVKKLLIGVFITSIFLSSCAFNQIDKVNNTKQESTITNVSNSKRWKTYTDQRFRFSVSYPEIWGIDIDDNWQPKNGMDASPTSGIDIFIDKNKSQRISVYGCVSGLNVQQPGSKKSKLSTYDGRLGDLSSIEFDNKIEMHFVLEEERVAVSVLVNKDVFEANKETIFEICKSIKILK